MAHRPDRVDAPVLRAGESMAVVLAALAVVLAAWAAPSSGALRVALVGVTVAAVAAALVVRSCDATARRGMRRSVCAVAVLVVVAGARSDHEWQAAQRVDEGAWRGWAVVVGDPAPVGRATRATLALDGRRCDLWAYGANGHDVQRLAAGDRVWFEGSRDAFGDGTAARRAAVRHVVSRCDVRYLGDVRDGPLVAVAANRVREMLRAAADASMAPADAALFTGLVIGDDLRQEATTVEQFRASGLSHLTAVSGQNVAYVLLAASPLLRRMRPLPRWLATAVLIVGFVIATRAEPSVLRAAVMALLTATAFAVGRPVHPVRTLSLAVIALVVVDPFLVWSVAFWLSVAATAGVCTVGPAVERRLPGPVWWRTPMALTLGAQAGVAVPSVLVFGRLPLVALVANPAAGPVAGAVMLLGLPAAAVSGTASALGLPVVGQVVMWPLGVGTRWVAEVARVASSVAVPAPVTAVGWLSVVVLLVSRRPRTRVPI